MIDLSHLIEEINNDTIVSGLATNERIEYGIFRNYVQRLVENS